MICVVCKKDRDEKDFYASTKCYRCLYNEKIKAHNAALEARKKSGVTICYYCGKEFMRSGKKSYCSDECIAEQRKVHNSAREHRKIHSPGGQWTTGQLWGRNYKGNPTYMTCSKCKRVLYEHRERVFCRFCDKGYEYDN